MPTTITTELDRILTEAQGTLRLVSEHDPEAPSPCEIGQPWVVDELYQTRWEPTLRDIASDFDGLERALELEIHPDIKTYYARYWADHVPVVAPDGDLTLLFVWNELDRDRLLENLINHAVACKHNKTPFSVFFASTEPDGEYYLTVDNTTGAVLVERPGHGPIRTAADSLSEFLATISVRSS